MLDAKYRPRLLREVIGQDRAVATIRRVLDQPDFAGGAFWLDGRTGIGKTTIAQAMARHLGVEPKPGSWSYDELDGHDCTVERVRELDAHARGAMLAMGWRVWVVNESHNLTPKAVQAFLSLLERLPSKWVFVFTTTEAGELFAGATNPLLDRCYHVSLTTQGLTGEPKKPGAFAKRLYEIAQAEGLNGRPVADYVRLLKREHGSFRAALKAMELGKLDD